MKIKLLSVLMLCFCIQMPHTLQAQQGFFEEGYIVLKGDTLHGLVERTDELRLSHMVSFKKTAADSARTYLPLELESFSFTTSGQTFTSVEVTILANAKKMTETRFAKNLLQGEASLYKLPLSSAEKAVILMKENFNVYILKKENVFSTLGQYEYQVEQRVRLDKKYIGILRAALDDCLDSRSTITDKLDFTDEALIALIDSYNRCKNPEAVTMHFTHTTPAEKKHGATMSYAKPLSTKGLLTYSHGYSAGYFWDISRPELSRTIIQSIGVNYLYLRHRQSYYVTTAINRPKEKVEVVDETHFIRVPLLAQVNFNNHKGSSLVPFVYGGLMAQVSTDNSLSYIDLIPLFSFGGGMYVKRLKFSSSLDVYGFTLSNVKLLSLGVGLRLDRNTPVLKQ